MAQLAREAKLRLSPGEVLFPLLDAPVALPRPNHVVELAARADVDTVVPSDKLPLGVFLEVRDFGDGEEV